MQCFRVSKCLVYLTGPRAILYNVYTFVAYFIKPSWRAQFRSIEVTNTFEDSERNRYHFWSLLSLIFREPSVFVLFTKFIKKLLSLIFWHFLKRGIFGTTSILLHHFSTIAFKNGDVLREDNLCSDETFTHLHQISPIFRLHHPTMSALARVSLSASGRSLVLRMSQPSSVAAVRSLQTTQANRDIDSGKSQGYGVLSYWGSSIFNLFVVRAD